MSECQCCNHADHDKAQRYESALRSLDGLFVAIRDAQPSGHGVPVSLKDLASGLHVQVRAVLEDAPINADPPSGVGL